MPIKSDLTFAARSESRRAGDASAEEGTEAAVRARLDAKPLNKSTSLPCRKTYPNPGPNPPNPALTPQPLP